MINSGKYTKLNYISWNILVVFLLGILGTKAEGELLNSNFGENEYESIETLFINNTTQIKNQLLFIEAKILLKISHKNKFLEIGPGPGYATEKVAKSFSKTAVVEPIKAYQIKHKGRGYITFIENFQNVKLHDLYDFILCSHVLYYVKRDQWDYFLKKIYDSIEPNGKALIVLLAPRGGWADLHLAIKSDYLNSKEIELALNRQGIQYEISFVQSFFKFPKRKGFEKIVKAFTIDNCFAPEAFNQLTNDKKTYIYKKIDEYIDRCKKLDGSYETIWEDGYIVLSKKG